MSVITDSKKSGAGCLDTITANENKCVVTFKSRWSGSLSYIRMSCVGDYSHIDDVREDAAQECLCDAQDAQNEIMSDTSSEHRAIRERKTASNGWRITGAGGRIS